MIITVITPPATEPVTLTEAKLHCKVDGTDDDTLITALIAGARQHAEDYCRRAFVTQTLELSLDYDDLFEHGSFIEIPRPPIASVTSVKSYDPEDEESTMTATDYRLSGDRIVLASGGAWPSGLRDRDCMIIRYVAGYGAASAVPEGIKAAIKQMVLQGYEQRESAWAECPASLYPFRVMRL